MRYPFIAVGLIVVFIIYLMYHLLIKKDMQKVKMMLYPGLFFIGVWLIIYYFFLY